MISDFGLRISDWTIGGRGARFNPQSTIHNPKSGMTLMELLVVISLMAILLGAAIPVLSPASDARRLREAARGATTFIGGARVRAKETGRPFGVALKKLSSDTGRTGPDGDNGVCLEMYYVEQPAPYAGFDDEARVRLALNPFDSALDQDSDPDYWRGGIIVQFVRFTKVHNDDELPYDLDYDPIPPLFRVGDVLEVAGKFYVFDKAASLDPKTGAEDTDHVDDQGFFEFSGLGLSAVSEMGEVVDLKPVTDGEGDPLPNSNNVVPYWTEPLRYKIHRQPVRTSTPPFQLPNKAAIDLEASGFGQGLRLHNPQQRDASNNFTPNNNADDVILMFSPEGALAESYVNSSAATGGAQRRLVTSNLYLLIGLRENQPAPATDFYSFTGTDKEKQDAKEKINWLNGDSRWVVVGAQSGSVLTAENAFVEPREHTSGSLDATSPDSLSQDLNQVRNQEINAAREFARQAVGMGGR